jgi:hypothetical protein
MKVTSQAFSPLKQAVRLHVRQLGLAILLMFANGGIASLAFAQVHDEGVVTTRQADSLRERLANLNAEISALKQSPRTMSSDYRLRQKLADAEVLGRQLTDAETKLRQSQTGRNNGSFPILVGRSPLVQSTDGPTELAAKSDILLDQAQKLSLQADRIESSLQRERIRGTLQARSRHLEQDPFTALEGPKRSLVFSRTEAKSAASDGNVASVPRNTESGAASTEGASRDLGAAAAPSASSSPPQNTPVAPGPVVGTTRNPSLVESGMNPGNSSVSLTFRALLDAKALSEVQSIEFSGDPNSRAKAMTAAISALRKQAHELETQAALLRGTK